MQVQVQWTSRSGRRPWMWISQCMCVCVCLCFVCVVGCCFQKCSIYKYNSINNNSNLEKATRRLTWLFWVEVEITCTVFYLCVRLCVYVCDCPIRTIEHVVAWSLTRSLLSVCVCVCVSVSFCLLYACVLWFLYVIFIIISFNSLCRRAGICVRTKRSSSSSET